MRGRPARRPLCYLVGMAFRRKEKKDRGALARALLVVVKAALACVALSVLLVVVANVYTVATTRDDLHTVDALADAHADAVVVLGASVFADGTLRTSLRTGSRWRSICTWREPPMRSSSAETTAIPTTTNRMP